MFENSICPIPYWYYSDPKIIKSNLQQYEEKEKIFQQLEQSLPLSSFESKSKL